MRPLLLDTCATIWLVHGDTLANAAVNALNETRDTGETTFVSPITAWELGMLVSCRRLQLLVTPPRWFARLFEAPGVRLADMSPDLLIASSFLPGTPPRDPADRIIAATAREYGATLITRDRTLLDYGEQGHLSVVAC